MSLEELRICRNSIRRKGERYHLRIFFMCEDDAYKKKNRKWVGPSLNVKESLRIERGRGSG